MDYEGTLSATSIDIRCFGTKDLRHTYHVRVSVLITFSMRMHTSQLTR